MKSLLALGVLWAACAAPLPPAEDTASSWPGRSVDPDRIDSAWVRQVKIPKHLERLGPESEAFVAGAVYALDSGDFAAYASAASGLVALGEPVVPYLGHMGDVPSDRDHFFRIVSVVLSSVFAKIRPDHVGLHLRSPYRAVRTAAAGAAGDRHLMEHAGGLVRLLDDERVEVRRAAVRSLRRLSNLFYGYRARDGAERRAEATARWRKLWGSG